MARANTYASSAPDVYFYPDRKWHGALAGVSYTFLKDVVSQIDARNSIYYMAAGNYPAMMDENVGQGCRLRTICPSWWIKRRPAIQAKYISNSNFSEESLAVLIEPDSYRE
jgi:hypothetical protein